MRLIDVKTLELKEFFHNIPPYAILSHTWGDEEVTFQEYLLATGHDAKRHANIKRKAGFSKILGACKRAQADKLAYVWCDTNCIDKTSSAELSEAINSMYAWYYNSVICYAFLADVDGKPGSFEKSRWFTRGWTLQELLAPKKVVFHDRAWLALGDRNSLAGAISQVTRIHVGALYNRDTVPRYSIAQRMSWAADRETSRREDIAYCLLGIFEINMPLLYGEGGRAFNRLQHEIIKISDDQSILAWEYSQPITEGGNILAESPLYFRLCGSVVRHPEIDRHPYSVTNLGMAVNLPMINTHIPRTVVAGLNCAKELRIRDGTVFTTRFCRIWIFLRHVQRKNYIRQHQPRQIIFLDQLYTNLVKIKRIDAYLSISEESLPMWRPGQTSRFTSLLKGHPSTTMNLCITISSGKMIIPGHIFKEVYLLDDFVIITLKNVKPSTVSHHIVGRGKAVTFLSVYWDDKGLPQESLHTTVNDPDLQLMNEMHSRPEWVCLFQPTTQNHSAACCRTPSSLHSLHSRLRQMCSRVTNTEKEQKTMPMITLGDQPLQDLHGGWELAVDIVFTEPPEPVSIWGN